MAVTFVNALAIQPVANQEVAVATIAGPLDILDAYVSGGAWADGTLTFFVYATVGALRAKVAVGIYGGPKAARITWVDPSGTTIEGSVHAGGTIYDLVVLAQPNQSYQPSRPAPINATFAGVNESDVVADNNTSGAAVAAFGGDATIATAAGFNQLADVAASMQGVPGILFKLYASCGAGSVEALVAQAQSGGPDAIASILREVILPAATQYRLAVALAQPGSSVSVTASLATYLQAGGGGGGGGGIAPGTPGQFLQTKAGPATAWGQGISVPLEFFGPTGTADDSPTLQAAIDATTVGAALYREGLAILITNPSTFATPVEVKEGTSILFGPGDWTFSSEWTANKGRCTIEGAGKGRTRIHSNIAAGAPTNAPFVGQPATAPIASVTIRANNVVGSSVLPVNSIAGLVIGSWITVTASVSGSAFQGGLYKIRALTGGGTPTITVDRPVKYQFGLNDVVNQWPWVVEDFTLGGMTIDGLSERFVEITISTDCVVHDLELNPSAGFDPLSIVASFDSLGFRNKFERCSANVGGLVAVAFALETQDSSEIVDCVAEGATGPAYELLDCATCSVRDVRGFNNGTGIVFTADGNLIGCVDCEVHASAFEGSTNTGIGVVNGSRGTRIVNCDARFSATAIGLGASDRTFITNVRADNASVSALALGPAGSVTVSGIDVSDCAGIAVNLGTNSDTAVEGLRCLGTTGTNAVYINGGRASIDGGSIETTNAIHIVRADAGELMISNAKIVSTTGGAIGLFATAAGALIVGKNVDVTTDPAAGECARADGGAVVVLDTFRGLAGQFGFVVSGGGTIRFTDRSDVSGCGTASVIGGGGGFFSRGQVVGAGVAVAVPWPDLKGTDRVTLTANGSINAVATPGVALNPGVGFTIGIDASASTWNYVVN